MSTISICWIRWSSTYGSIGNPARWTRPNRDAGGNDLFPDRQPSPRRHAGAARSGLPRLPARDGRQGRQLDRGCRRKTPEKGHEEPRQGEARRKGQGESAGGQAMTRRILFALFAVLLLTGVALGQQKDAVPPVEWAQLSSEHRALLRNLE